MFIDRVYQAVQQLMNKEQLGYFKPITYNLFLGIAARAEYNNYYTVLKTNVRKMNWMLDGRDFANISEHNRQLLEYFSTSIPLDTTASGLETEIERPSDCEFIEDILVFSNNKRISKVHYKDYLDLLRNIYASPTDCSPICSLVGNTLKISPNTITKVKLHYLRKPKTAKWTFQEVSGKPFFDPTKSDFQDIDLPETSYENLVLAIAEMAGVSIRDTTMIQSSNQNQAENAQQNNAQ